MISIEDQLNDILSLPSENELVEWKEAKNNFDFDDLGRYFSALSNEANLGNKKSAWFVFGVKNDKSIVGTNYRTDTVKLNDLKLEVAKQTGGISFTEIHVTFKDKKRIIIFEIPAAPRGIPVPWQGHYYARNNNSLAPLNMEKREGFIRKNPKIAKKEIIDWSNKIFLNKAKLTINGKITRASIVLLGKLESEHYINPSCAKISWILKDKAGVEKDYEHFSCPLILAVDNVFKKIRNLRYRYISDNTLFPDEIDRYDPTTIREAINNCIAHQDYELGGKINVIENEDESLVFSNLGSFIPGSIENVIESDSPQEYYRNKFLADAMVSVNMIDTIGSGIRKMFMSQKSKFFPLPDYDLSENKVKLIITGKVIDIKYAEKLAQIPDLDLKTIIALDKVQKRRLLSTYENKLLRTKGFIEGKSPNIYISSKIAIKTGKKGDYMKMKGIEDEYAKKMIIDYLSKFKSASRADFEYMLLNKIPDVLDYQQKKDKVKNLLQKLKKEGKIYLENHLNWALSK